MDVKPANHNSPNQRPHTDTHHQQINPNNLGILERDHTTALALSIFLGFIGIDQFYLGKTGKGILKLFTFGLFGILWVIDIIMIATKSVGGVVWEEDKVSDTGKSKNWFIKHKVLSVFIALFVIGIIFAATSNNSPKTTNTASTSTNNSKSTNTSQAAKTTSTPQRQVEGTAVTLGAGTFTGGKDVAVGLYSVTTTSGQSGNFIVTGSGENYDEILGVSDGQGVPSVETQISKGDQIQISGLSSVTFTPVTTPFVTTHTAETLGAGTWTVGQDIGAGRYVAASASGQSGNFIVTGNDSYDEILGGGSATGGVPNVTVNLTDGDVIQISGMYGVTMTPTN